MGFFDRFMHGNTTKIGFQAAQVKADPIKLIANASTDILSKVLNGHMANKTHDVLSKAAIGEQHYIFGICAMLVAAWAQSISGICTRKTKELPYSVFLFAYGMFASGIMIVFLFGDYCIYYWGKTPRIFTYNKEQYGYSLLCAFTSALCCNCFTIAIQSYKLAFVMIIAYETLIYSFISDLAIFHYSFNVQQMIGAAVILGFSIWAVVEKLNADGKPK